MARRRIVRGVGGYALVAGLSVFGAGLIFAGGYDWLYEPSISDKVVDPKLEDAKYPVPGWLLVVGVLMIIFGIVVTVAGWMMSPRWTEPVEPSDRISEWLLFLSLSVAAIGSFVTVLVAGHRSPLLPNLIVTSALAVVFGLWRTWRLLSDR